MRKAAWCFFRSRFQIRVAFSETAYGLIFCHCFLISTYRFSIIFLHLNLGGELKIVRVKILSCLMKWLNVAPWPQLLADKIPCPLICSVLWKIQAEWTLHCYEGKPLTKNLIPEFKKIKFQIRCKGMVSIGNKKWKFSGTDREYSLTEERHHKSVKRANW